MRAAVSASLLIVSLIALLLASGCTLICDVDWSTIQDTPEGGESGQALPASSGSGGTAQ